MDAEDATRAVERLCGQIREVRAAAVLGPGGEVLAASVDPSGWKEPVAALFGAAAEPGHSPVEAIHVGTEEGEVMLVREGGHSMVAVAARFALSSLILYDMRRLLAGDAL